MAAIVQQFPTRNSAFQDANGLITGVWYRTLAAMWARTGGGTSDTTTQQLQAEIDALSAAKLDKAGGTMTGALTLSGAPATALGAATKAYVDGGDATEAAARAAADALRLPLTGGTLTGALTAPYYIATVYTVATLPTGENAHTTVRPPEWWSAIFAAANARHPQVIRQISIEVHDDGHQD